MMMMIIIIVIKCFRYQPVDDPIVPKHVAINHYFIKLSFDGLSVYCL